MKTRKEIEMCGSAVRVVATMVYGFTELDKSIYPKLVIYCILIMRLRF